MAEPEHVPDAWSLDGTALLRVRPGTRSQLAAVFTDVELARQVHAVLSARAVEELPAVAAERQRREDLAAELRRHVSSLERQVVRVREGAQAQVREWLREADGLAQTSENVDRHRSLRLRAHAVCGVLGLDTVRRHDAERAREQARAAVRPARHAADPGPGDRLSDTATGG